MDDSTPAARRAAQIRRVAARTTGGGQATPDGDQAVADPATGGRDPFSPAAQSRSDSAASSHLPPSGAPVGEAIAPGGRHDTDGSGSFLGQRLAARAQEDEGSIPPAYDNDDDLSLEGDDGVQSTATSVSDEGGEPADAGGEPGDADEGDAVSRHSDSADVDYDEAEYGEEMAEAEQAVLDDLARLSSERDEYLDQLQRVKADFDNYRKRVVRQQTEHLERAAEGLAEKLLDVIDNFDAAITHGKGFEQVHRALMAILEKEGLERIFPVDQPFDPNEADAVAHEEGDDGPVVSEVLRPGYRWKGRVLRPAMVRVRG